MNKCDWCGTGRADMYFTGETNSNVCNHCFNAMMSERLGVKEERMIESFMMEDGEGNSRTFHVGMRIYPSGIFLEAKEDNDLGYEFAVHGELNENQQDLLKRLIGKVRKGICQKQVKTSAFPDGQVYHSLIHDRLVGRFDYDKASDDLPMVLIDGKPFTWVELGKMLMTYEGFQFKLEMFDMTDDV